MSIGDITIELILGIMLISSILTLLIYFIAYVITNLIDKLFDI